MSSNSIESRKNVTRKSRSHSVAPSEPPKFRFSATPSTPPVARRHSIQPLKESKKEALFNGSEFSSEIVCGSSSSSDEIELPVKFAKNMPQSSNLSITKQDFYQFEEKLLIILRDEHNEIKNTTKNIKELNMIVKNNLEEKAKTLSDSIVEKDRDIVSLRTEAWSLRRNAKQSDDENKRLKLKLKKANEKIKKIRTELIIARINNEKSNIANKALNNITKNGSLDKIDEPIPEKKNIFSRILQNIQGITAPGATQTKTQKIKSRTEISIEQSNQIMLDYLDVAINAAIEIISESLLSPAHDKTQ